MPINVTQSSMPSFSEYIDEIKDLWDSHWLTNNGVKHQDLEKRLSDYLKVSNITLFVNGHMALESVIAAMELTGEVITTPFTFISTTNAIVRNGLTPVFCDINPEDYTMDVGKIESLITDKTSAILPVHAYGNVCDVWGIDQVAKKHGLKVIYDAAHAFGVSVDGRGIGTFGDASMFSFHATKVFNTIEGGALTYQDPVLKEKLESLKNFGLSGGDALYAGGNAKMNEFQAAMGLCNLRHVDEEIAKRKRVADRYCERLSDFEGIRLSQSQPGVASNYSYFPVVFDGENMNRDQVLDKLRTHDIHARKYFYPLIGAFSCYSGKYDIAATPNAGYLADRVLTLPLYANLSLEAVDTICDIIIKQ